MLQLMNSPRAPGGRSRDPAERDSALSAADARATNTMPDHSRAGTRPAAMAQPPNEPHSAPRTWSRSRLLNVWVDNLGMDDLLRELEQGIVFTLNPDHIYHLQRNQKFQEAYNQADFITSDSKYVYWGLHWIGRPIKEKVSGSDLVPKFCQFHGNNPRVGVFLLGAAEGVAQLALESINKRVGRSIIVGAHSPSMNFVNDDDEIRHVLEIIRNSGANVLIVGLGAPKQEIWITRYRHELPGVRIFMGVGAVIDYEAGVVRRAPPWMTRRGLEWVYRLVSEPRRYWRRYLRDIEYFWLLALDGVGLYRGPTP